MLSMFLIQCACQEAVTGVKFLLFVRNNAQLQIANFKSNLHILQKPCYQLQAARVGISVIIDTLSSEALTPTTPTGPGSSVPGPGADARGLSLAYGEAGFDVFCYHGCTAQVRTHKEIIFVPVVQTGNSGS